MWFLRLTARMVFLGLLGFGVIVGSEQAFGLMTWMGDFSGFFGLFLGACAVVGAHLWAFARDDYW